MLGADSTFAADLYGRLASLSGNLIFSPTSIQLALAMAYAGARGDTASEMERAVALGAESHATFASLLSHWEKLAHPDGRVERPIADVPELRKFHEAELARRRIVLRLVNRLWTQSGRRLRQEFVGLLQDQYRAPIAELDFRGDPEAAREQINRWVSSETEQKITELIARGMIAHDTHLLITNAVYFKAQWNKQFDKRATREKPFFAEGAREVRVQMMRQIDVHPLATFSGGQLLELPYASGGLAMDLILPAERNGLAEIERRFASGELRDWLGALKTTQVELMLPRFRTSSGFDLAQPLGELGLGKAFSSREADFSGMDGTRELFISGVVHQAIVDVDEHGTEAAAATVTRITLGRTSQIGGPVPFHADHPFLFLIRDTSSGAILFLGRVVDPQAKV